jgi:hypothetical protein
MAADDEVRAALQAVDDAVAAANVIEMPRHDEGVPRSSTPVPGTGNTDEEDLFYDVAALLDGTIPEPPKPVLGYRSDGNALFYAGQVNVVFGDPESGKTFLCLAAVVEALVRLRTAVVLDMDHNGPEATITRLLELGAPADALRDPERFRYVEPEDPSHLDRVIRACKEWRPAVAVVDSIGELLPIYGLSSNSPDDYTIANSRVLKPLAKAGAAVIGIDHLAKDAASRATGSTGTTAKKRTVGGVSIRVTVKDAFTPGKGGKAHLTINKDRHGGLRRHCPVPDGGEAYAGTFVLKPDMSWLITAPSGVEQVQTAPVLDMAELGKLVPPPTSVRDVKDRLGWGTNRATEALRSWRSSVPETSVEEQGTLGLGGDE